jgi:hypothetical protein
MATEELKVAGLLAFSAVFCYFPTNIAHPNVLNFLSTKTTLVMKICVPFLYGSLNSLSMFLGLCVNKK